MRSELPKLSVQEIQDLPRNWATSPFLQTLESQLWPDNVEDNNNVFQTVHWYTIEQTSPTTALAACHVALTYLEQKQAVLRAISEGDEKSYAIGALWLVSPTIEACDSRGLAQAGDCLVRKMVEDNARPLAYLGADPWYGSWVIDWYCHRYQATGPTNPLPAELSDWWVKYLASDERQAVGAINIPPSQWEETQDRWIDLQS